MLDDILQVDEIQVGVALMLPESMKTDVASFQRQIEALLYENARLRSEHLHDVHLLGEQSGLIAKLREALTEIVGTKWVATVDEAMRGGNTPACAAEAMCSVAQAALAAAKLPPT